jgi:predicted nucleotidyltransferase
MSPFTIESTPTGDPAVNEIIQHVLNGAEFILDRHFIAMYLDGSLASGDFDQDSDIDFVVVTDEDVQGKLFETLRSFHDRLSILPSPWAIQLEGFYISLPALRRHDPAHVVCPNIERGGGERLKMVTLDQGWDVHRWVLRERGITLTGPDPKTLIDPVPPDRLRQAAAASAPWLRQILAHPAQVTSAGYQSYIVLTLCRILYTLRTGQVASKPAAVQWAQANLDARWSPLIERAWIDRHSPNHAPSPENMAETLELIRFVLDQSGEAQ